MEGLTELQAALRRLPQELTTDAVEIVDRNVEQAKSNIENAYPEDTGNLRKGLVIRRFATQASARGHAGFGALLINRAPHSGIYENGSELRYTDSGAARGRMPPGRIFIPMAIRQRRVMVTDLIALVRRAGFEVSLPEAA